MYFLSVAKYSTHAVWPCSLVYWMILLWKCSSFSNLFETKECLNCLTDTMKQDKIYYVLNVCLHTHTCADTALCNSLYTSVCVHAFLFFDDVAQTHILSPVTAWECPWAQSVTGVLHPGAVSCTLRAPLLGLAPPGIAAAWENWAGKTTRETGFE